MSMLRPRAEAENSHLRLVILLPAPPGLLYLCFVQLLQSEGKILEAQLTYSDAAVLWSLMPSA